MTGQNDNVLLRNLSGEVSDHLLKSGRTLNERILKGSP